jgi:hypothetical protein
MYIYKLKTKMKEKNSGILNERAVFETHKRNFAEATKQADTVLGNKQLDINATDALIEQINQDEVQKMTRLLVFSASEIPHIINRDRHFDKDRVICFNHALREIITDFDDTYLSPEALIRSIMTFAIGRGLVRDQDRTAVFEGLSSDFIGMWNEQAFENMAVFANVPNRYGDTQEDREGKDIYIEISPEKPATPKEEEWVSIDVKSSKNTLLNYTPHGMNGTKSKLMTIKDPAKLFMEASYDNPVINVIHDDVHFLVAIDYGSRSGQLPDQIAAPSFKQFNKQTVGKIFESLLSYMKNSQVLRYEFDEGEFSAEHQARYLGRLATRS